jgi:formate dehydrogenase subunit beta
MMRRLVSEVFKVDPESVKKDTMYKGHLYITYDGSKNDPQNDSEKDPQKDLQKDFSIPKLEEAGYGRRSNCRRCKMKIPRQADLACGQWGVREELVGKSTFVEVCSQRGAELIDRAREAKAIITDVPDNSCIKVRKKSEDAVIKLADNWRERDFAPLQSRRGLLAMMIEETGRCIKCYTCVEVCPALFNTTKPYMTAFPGKVPPEFAFHLLRYAHVAESCIDCGQCEELCPMDIPNALFMHAIEADLEALYGYHAGEDMLLPKFAIMKEPEI